MVVVPPRWLAPIGPEITAAHGALGVRPQRLRLAADFIHLPDQAVDVVPRRRIGCGSHGFYVRSEQKPRPGSNRNGGAWRQAPASSMASLHSRSASLLSSRRTCSKVTLPTFPISARASAYSG